MDFIIKDKDAKIGKTIHLIRHGQTDFNLKNIIQGSGINSDLNENGRLQASKFYESYKHVPYKHIYTSQLKRAIQSVNDFIDQGIPHSPLEELNEINWGIMEGKIQNPETVKLYHETINNWKNGLLNQTVPEGETPLEMYQRQALGLELLMNKSPDEDIVLICMHGRAIRSFLCLLTGRPLHEMENWDHSNLCLYSLKFNGTTFDIIQANDTTHLV
jgi:broad specificity phosphatase PhoE